MYLLCPRGKAAISSSPWLRHRFLLTLQEQGCHKTLDAVGSGKHLHENIHMQNQRVAALVCTRPRHYPCSAEKFQWRSFETKAGLRSIIAGKITGRHVWESMGPLLMVGAAQDREAMCYDQTALQ